MPPFLATCVFVGLIFFLLWLEKRATPSVSGAVWIPLFWILILGSRPVSFWLGGQAPNLTDTGFQDGSPKDRLAYLILISLSVMVLVRRRFNIYEAIRSNTALFFFFLYLLATVIWANDSFVSFKRLFKDFGNIIMAFVILTEAKPYIAFKSLVARACYILIPLSVLLVKYYPDLGRYFIPWEWQYAYSGVTLNKNLLGMLLLVASIFLPLHYRDLLKSSDYRRGILFSAGVVLVSGTWLLFKAHCATALVCAVLCLLTQWALTRPTILNSLRQHSAATFGIIAVPIICLFIIPNGAIMSALGRDSSLTGRKEIWHNVLAENVNPIVGDGYYSFWTDDRATRVSGGYYYKLNEAHNGYLETYVNSGIIGCLLLGIVLVSFLVKCRAVMETDGPLAGLCLSVLLAVLLSNLTESVFNRLNVIWFSFLLTYLFLGEATKAAVEEG